MDGFYKKDRSFRVLPFSPKMYKEYVVPAGKPGWMTTGQAGAGSHKYAECGVIP